MMMFQFLFFFGLAIFIPPPTNLVIYINKPIGELCGERFYRENVSDFP